jgi:hypothetical protein
MLIGQLQSPIEDLLTHMQIMQMRKRSGSSHRHATSRRWRGGLRLPDGIPTGGKITLLQNELFLMDIYPDLQGVVASTCEEVSLRVLVTSTLMS